MENRNEPPPLPRTAEGGKGLAQSRYFFCAGFFRAAFLAAFLAAFRTVFFTVATFLPAFFAVFFTTFFALAVFRATFFAAFLAAFFTTFLAVAAFVEAFFTAFVAAFFAVRVTFFGLGVSLTARGAGGLALGASEALGGGGDAGGGGGAGGTGDADGIGSIQPAPDQPISRSRNSAMLAPPYGRDAANPAAVVRAPQAPSCGDPLYLAFSRHFCKPFFLFSDSRGDG